MISTMKINTENMRSGASGGFTNATDAADYLVKKGMPFRQAHEVIGKMVLYAIQNGKSLEEFTMDEFKACSDIIEDDIYDAISMETCVNERKVIGAPAPEAVMYSIGKGKEFLNSLK